MYYANLTYLMLMVQIHQPLGHSLQPPPPPQSPTQPSAPAVVSDGLVNGARCEVCIVTLWEDNIGKLYNTLKSFLGRDFCGKSLTMARDGSGMHPIPDIGEVAQDDAGCQLQTMRTQRPAIRHIKSCLCCKTRVYYTSIGYMFEVRMYYAGAFRHVCLTHISKAHVFVR